MCFCLGVGEEKLESAEVSGGLGSGGVHFDRQSIEVFLELCQVRVHGSAIFGEREKCIEGIQSGFDTLPVIHILK